MMAVLRWISGFLIAVAIAAFAILNRAPVAITWNPFLGPVELPFYIPGLMLMAVGFILGVFTVWLNTDPLHKEKRRARRHIKDLEKKLETLQEERIETLPADFFPSLPHKKK